MARSSNGVEDIDIWRTAKILIDSHGEGAWLEAAQRADRGVEDGNADVVRVWKLRRGRWGNYSGRSQMRASP
jgi:hypothetical protein